MGCPKYGEDFTGDPARSTRSGDLRSVRVPRGGALAFWHGEHPLSLLHEGSPVTRGVKTIVRSDVLYMVPGATCPA